MNEEQLDVGPLSVVVSEEPLSLYVGKVLRSAQDIVAVTPTNQELRSRQEWARLFIAGALLLILAVIVVAAVWSVQSDSAWANMDKLLCALLAPVIGLLGTAIGFYFRIEEENRPKNGSR